MCQIENSFGCHADGSSSGDGRRHSRAKLCRVGIPIGNGNGNSTVSPPYDIAVTSTLDPNPSGATHSNVTANELVNGQLIPYSVPAGELALQWRLSYIPDGSTTWQLCKQSGNWSLSTSAGSAFQLDDSAFTNPAQTVCGDGVYGLETDGLAWVNNGWHGVLRLYSGPEHLTGSTPSGGGPIHQVALPTLPPPTPTPPLPPPPGH